MGCIMTPMPNHLSTLKPHHNRVENTPGRAGEKERGSVDEMAWLSWLKRDI